MKLSKLLCLIMAMAMVVALCACESSGDKDAVAKYVEENQTEISKAVGAVGDQIALDVRADGTKIVMECTIKVDLPDGAEEQMEKTLEAMKPTFETTLKGMQEEEPAVSALVVRYLDNSGDLLAELEV